MNRREHEAKTHVRATMAKHGWKHLHSTPLGKPVRFGKIGPDGKEYCIKSANGGVYRLEVWRGHYLPAYYCGNANIKVYDRLVTPRFETPLGMALWFDRVAVTLLRLCE